MGKVKSAKGKSKKATWKKISHPDVDEFLVEQRRDERLGIKEKTDDQLFFLDQLGFDDDFSQLTKQKKEAELKRLTRSRSGPLVDLAELRCNQILKPDSNVKDPVIKRNPLRKGGGLKTVDMKLKEEIRYYKQEREEAMKTLPAKAEAVDLWSTTVTDPKQNAILANEWITEAAKRNLVRRSTHKPGRKTNEIKPVETPHPGMSYNPSFMDHQDILRQTIEIEKKSIKAEQKVERATAVSKSIKDEMNTIEIEVKSEPESDSDDEKTVIQLSKPRTKAHKRREKEQRDREMLLQQKKQRSKLEAQVFRVKSLKKEIEKTEEKCKIRLNKRIDKIVQRDRFGVKTLSRFKYEELKPQPVLSEDLAGGLRGAKSANSGDLLLDRFKSLQKRNVIEPRVKQTQKRKHKLKRFTRQCDKMEWEKTGMWNGEKIVINNTAHRRKNPPRR